jgi:hypothetical protein
LNSGGQSRAGRRWIVHATAPFRFADRRTAKSCDWADTWGTQVAETPDKATQADNQPEAAERGPSGRVTATVVSLSALVIIAAATANSLPNFDHFSLPKFALPNFNHFSWPNFDRFTAQPPPPPPKTAAAPIRDPAISAILKDIQVLKDIQSSQQQNAAVLVSLTQSSASQQSDLKRISRQITALSVQTDALQSAVTPLTTSSIPHSNARARFIRASRKTNPPPLPKPVGPVSVGGAPLIPAPATRSGA